MFKLADEGIGATEVVEGLLVFRVEGQGELEVHARGNHVAFSSISHRGAVEAFFATQEVEIPGVTPEDVVHTLGEALEKTSYTQYGIHADEVNNVFSVVRSLADIGRCDVLLLPYCAKLADCEYRFRDGCTRCGSCDIGDAYDLAEKYDVVPISIQNYEHLEEMLERAAINQEREIETLIAALLGLFEPMLILLMGGVVLIIVLAILLPIFDLNQLVQ